MKNDTVVGHVPRKVSALCSLFLRHNGARISCQTSGGRRYSEDLPQGGMEIPCVLTFMGEPSHVDKVERFMKKLSSTDIIETQQSEHS